MQWKQATIVGVGLLGGSLGMAMRQRHLAGEVVGLVRREASVRECLEASAVDRASVAPADSVAQADLVVLATPLGQMVPQVEALLPYLQKGAVVTDVGSVKGSVVAELTDIIGSVGATFLGSHPMAGSEKMGVQAARADLFQEAVVVVTPTQATDSAILDRLLGLWQSVGARTLTLSPQEHDVLVARSSHLPHVLAAQLTRMVLGDHPPEEQAMLCANGFRDTTRIAGGSPEMWRDIVLSNRAQVRAALKEFRSGLDQFDSLLEQGDPSRLITFFEESKALRDAWCARSRSPE